MGRINAQPSDMEVQQHTSQTDFQNSNSKDSAEFFILSDLYSEALVVFLA
jgi:hypothetical protein